MCSFLFSTKFVDNVEKLNYYLKFRGPDCTEVKQINNHLYLHNLLSITGKFAPQPYIKDQICLLYNGEIYNFKKHGQYDSDGECIIPLYEKYGPFFTKHLDGEFAICLIDYEKNLIIVSSDIFKTKPLFYGTSEFEFGCSTYKTPLKELGLNVTSVEPNTTYVFDLHTKQLIGQEQIYNFNLLQYKENYVDWINAFEKAVIKRATNTDKKVFIGLSSGYDSGAIFNVLRKNDLSFNCYSLTGTENQQILEERIKLKNKNCESTAVPKTEKDYTFSHLIIRKRTEPFVYTIKSDKGDYTETNKALIEDEGSNNFATICRLARRDDCKICLSGTGADEIISDYGFNGERFFSHSNFGGLFPEKLETIFPWGSFYKSTMESYLAKEEYVGGSYGIEMRYPFLDKQVVQEFLWLKPELKNKAYKAPLDFYFKAHQFPYEENQKRGF